MDHDDTGCRGRGNICVVKSKLKIAGKTGIDYPYASISK